MLIYTFIQLLSEVKRKGMFESLFSTLNTNKIPGDKKEYVLRDACWQIHLLAAWRRNGGDN